MDHRACVPRGCTPGPHVPGTPALRGNTHRWSPPPAPPGRGQPHTGVHAGLFVLATAAHQLQVEAVTEQCQPVVETLFGELPVTATRARPTSPLTPAGKAIRPAGARVNQSRCIIARLSCADLAIASRHQLGEIAIAPVGSAPAGSGDPVCLRRPDCIQTSARNRFDAGRDRRLVEPHQGKHV